MLIKILKDLFERTPLHYACQEGYLPIVEYLISKGANIEAKDEDDWTPLKLASTCGRFHVAKYLISKGANTNLKQNSEKT